MSEEERVEDRNKKENEQEIELKANHGEEKDEEANEKEIKEKEWDEPQEINLYIKVPYPEKETKMDQQTSCFLESSMAEVQKYMPYCATFKKMLLSKKRRPPHKLKEAVRKFFILIWDPGIGGMVQDSCWSQNSKVLHLASI